MIVITSSLLNFVQAKNFQILRRDDEMIEAFKMLLTPLPCITIISSTHYYSPTIEYDDDDDIESESESEMET